MAENALTAFCGKNINKIAIECNDSTIEKCSLDSSPRSTRHVVNTNLNVHDLVRPVTVQSRSMLSQNYIVSVAFNKPD